MAQDDLEKTEAIPISFMTWKSKSSKRTILSTLGAEASACRDALDLAEYTRAMLCEVLIRGEVLPDKMGEEHMPIRVITDCKSLFGCLAKDASVPEDRGTALTVASLRERCSAGVGRETTIGTDVVADKTAICRRTDTIVGWSILEKRSDLGNH